MFWKNGNGLNYIYGNLDVSRNSTILKASKAIYPFPYSKNSFPTSDFENALSFISNSPYPFNLSSLNLFLFFSNNSWKIHVCHLFPPEWYLLMQFYMTRSFGSWTTPSLIQSQHLKEPMTLLNIKENRKCTIFMWRWLRTDSTEFVVNFSIIFPNRWENHSNPIKLAVIQRSDTLESQIWAKQVTIVSISS